MIEKINAHTLIFVPKLSVLIIQPYSKNRTAGLSGRMGLAIR
jgi:hypothetical protein